MATYSKIFERYLVERKIKYTRHEETIFQIDYQGENMKTIPLCCSFDEDGELDMAMVLCLQIARYTENNELLAMAICNGMNSIVPYLRFYVDDDHEVVARCDVRIREPYFCDDIIATMNLMAEAVDGIYEDFVKEMWS